MKLKKRLAMHLMKSVPLNELSEYVGHEKMRRGLDEAFGKVSQQMIDMYFKEGDGFKTIGTQPNLLNVLETTEARNICIWWDGTLKPMRGHMGACGWKFDGQIWWHL